MDLKLVLPKSLVYIGPEEKVIFTAGPILGGGDWQKRAIAMLADQIPDAFIVCPCRYAPPHSLHQLALPGETPQQWQARGLDPFPNQTLWERYYLTLAAEQGAVLFWLPEEDRDNPRPRERGPYARDSYGELGEWRARKRYRGARIVIGMEPDFPGASVIKKNYLAMLGHDFDFHETLEATIRAAVDLANSPIPEKTAGV